MQKKSNQKQTSKIPQDIEEQRQILLGHLESQKHNKNQDYIDYMLIYNEIETCSSEKLADFIDYLKLQNWSNGLEVLGNLKSLVKKYPNENLLCEIAFDKIDTDTITISDIRFYNLSSTTSQGNYYIIDKNESLLINVISKRTYSNVLFEISQACFN